MIKLYPTIRYWFMVNFFNLIIIFILLGIATFFEFERYIMILFGVLTLLILFNCMWSWLVLSNITYIIDVEQIIIKSGVFNRTTNYLEMYRIYDFKKEQHLFEASLGLMNVVLSCRDISHPTVKFIGIQNSDDVIPVIRERVEKEKKRKNIVEFNNPYSITNI